MKLSELVEILQDIQIDYANANLPDPDVELVTQPRYPIKSTLKGVVAAMDIPEDVDHPNTVFLVEGSQTGYGSKKLWDYV